MVLPRVTVRYIQALLLRVDPSITIALQIPWREGGHDKSRHASFYTYCVDLDAEDASSF